MKYVTRRRHMTGFSCGGAVVTSDCNGRGKFPQLVYYLLSCTSNRLIKKQMVDVSLDSFFSQILGKTGKTLDCFTQTLPKQK